MTAWRQRNGYEVRQAANAQHAVMNDGHAWDDEPYAGASPTESESRTGAVHAVRDPDPQREQARRAEIKA
jgi:hypothetical protein